MEHAFSHHCFTNVEATAALSQDLQENAIYRRITYLCLALCLGAVAALFIGIYLVPLGPTMVLGAFITTIIAGAGFMYRINTGLGNVGCATAHLEPLNSEEKAKLIQLGEASPVIAQTVGSWLSEGKELRVRDYWAIRRYAAELERSSTDSTLDAWRAHASLVECGTRSNGEITEGIGSR
jgi:hypothetical protein